MAAGEDEAEPVVLRQHPTGLRPARGHVAQLLTDDPQSLAVPRVAAQPVNRPVARGREEPGTRIARYAVARPRLEGNHEGLLDELFREFPVPEDANQGSHQPSTLLADGFRQACIDERPWLGRHSCQALPQSRVTTGRISSVADEGHPDTSEMASSRSATSMIA